MPRRPLLLVSAGLMLSLFCAPLQAEAGMPCFPNGVPVLEKGGFIFFTPGVFQKPKNQVEARQRNERLEWIKRFRICLTNGYVNFADKDLRELHAAGCELFIYRWFNGFYTSEILADDTPAATKSYLRQFPEIVKLFRQIHSRPEWLLNPRNPIQGGGATHPAYFYDYANPEFRRFYAESIRRHLETAQYDGIFFDYIGSWALPTEIKGVWETKHPGSTYDEAGIEFLKELREVIGTKRIFGNQAYRLPEAYHDIIDYDASESLATSFVWGKKAKVYMEGMGEKQVLDTFYRPWDGPGGYKETARRRLAMARKMPRMQICDINYLQPWRVPTGETVEVEGKQTPVYTRRTDRPAIFYGYAISKLVGGCVFASDWYARGYGKDDIYFLDLGKPVDARFVETRDAVARYYENGFVVVTRTNGRVHFKPDPKCPPAGITELWDVYEGIRVHDWTWHGTVTVFPAYYPSTRSYYPSGRVYIYLRKQQP